MSKEARWGVEQGAVSEGERSTAQGQQATDGSKLMKGRQIKTKSLLNRVSARQPGNQVTSKDIHRSFVGAKT